MAWTHDIVRVVFSFAMFMAGVNKLTPAISAEFHGELKSQIDVFAKEVWPFLGLDGTQLRRIIGCAEAFLGPLSLLPLIRRVSIAVLLVIMAGAVTQILARHRAQNPAILPY